MTHRVWQSRLNYRDTSTVIRAANGPGGLHHVEVFWSVESHEDGVIALKYRLVRDGNSSPWIKKRRSLTDTDSPTHRARRKRLHCHLQSAQMTRNVWIRCISLSWLAQFEAPAAKKTTRQRFKRWDNVLNDNASYHDKQYKEYGPNPDSMAAEEWYRAFSWLLNEAIIRGEVLQRSLYYQRHEKSLSLKLLIS